MQITTEQAQQLLDHLDQSARFAGQALAQNGLNASKQCHAAIGNALELADMLQAGIQADSAPAVARESATEAAKAVELIPTIANPFTQDQAK